MVNIGPPFAIYTKVGKKWLSPCTDCATDDRCLPWMVSLRVPPNSCTLPPWNPAAPREARNDIKEDNMNEFPAQEEIKLRQDPDDAQEAAKPELIPVRFPASPRRESFGRSSKVRTVPSL